MSKPLMLPENPRILIVRLSAVGDVIHAMPLVVALRERFPKAFLAWVSSPPAATLLQGHEALDELIVVGRRYLRSPREMLALRRRLRALRVDIAIDAQGLTKSAVVAWLSGAPVRIGFGDQWGREISRWFYTEQIHTKTKHTVDRTLELIEPLGIVRPAVRFHVPLNEADRQAADRMLTGLAMDAPFAIINAGAGWRSKLWPPERFGAVARHLGRLWRLPSLVVWAGAEERALAETIVASADGHARLAPSTTLRELAALCEKATLFVSSDTGPLHLAVAVGTPCVGLYGPWPAEENGPYGPGHVVVQKMAIYGPSSQRRRAPRELMEAIDVPSVCETCDTILSRTTVERNGSQVGEVRI